MLADPAAAVDEDLVETAPARLIRSGVAQVPFAEDGGGIARTLEHVAHGESAFGQRVLAAWDDDQR